VRRVEVSGGGEVGVEKMEKSGEERKRMKKRRMEDKR